MTHLTLLRSYRSAREQNKLMSVFASASANRLRCRSYHIYMIYCSTEVRSSTQLGTRLTQYGHITTYCTGKPNKSSHDTMITT